MFDIVSISHNIWKLLLLGRRGLGVRGGSAAQQHHQQSQPHGKTGSTIASTTGSGVNGYQPAFNYRPQVLTKFKNTESSKKTIV